MQIAKHKIPESPAPTINTNNEEGWQAVKSRSAAKNAQPNTEQSMDVMNGSISSRGIRGN